jgi:hypothetical protein
MVINDENAVFVAQEALQYAIAGDHERMWAMLDQLDEPQRLRVAAGCAKIAHVVCSVEVAVAVDYASGFTAATWTPINPRTEETAAKAQRIRERKPYEVYAYMAAVLASSTRSVLVAYNTGDPAETQIAIQNAADTLAACEDVVRDQPQC